MFKGILREVVENTDGGLASILMGFDGITVDSYTGADSTVAGCVTLAVLGMTILPVAEAGAADAAFDAVAPAGRLAAFVGACALVTFAVIECAGSTTAPSARTSNLRFMNAPFIALAATTRGPGCPCRRSRR